MLWYICEYDLKSQLWTNTDLYVSRVYLKIHLEFNSDLYSESRHQVQHPFPAARAECFQLNAPGGGEITSASACWEIAEGRCKKVQPQCIHKSHHLHSLTQHTHTRTPSSLYISHIFYIFLLGRNLSRACSRSDKNKEFIIPHIK